MDKLEKEITFSLKLPQVLVGLVEVAVKAQSITQPGAPWLEGRVQILSPLPPHYWLPPPSFLMINKVMISNAVEDCHYNPFVTPGAAPLVNSALNQQARHQPGTPLLTTQPGLEEMLGPTEFITIL